MKLIADEEALEESLSLPTDGAIAAIDACPGDIVVLGVAGKMGISLARMARRALDELGRRDQVIGVSRFSKSDGLAEAILHAAGVKVHPCDLLDRNAVENLPDAPNVLFMAGQKFGTSSNPELTWAINTLAPANCAEKYRNSRIVAFSTGCVYPMTPIESNGSREADNLGPPGDYANSCVGRERVFSYYAKNNQTNAALVRLNYAIDLRYGVLLDVAQKVWNRVPVDVTMGYVNVIWQGDANAQTLQCLPHAASPAFTINITGPEKVSVRALAGQFGTRFGIPAKITGAEAPLAWLSDSSQSQVLFGKPAVSLDQMIDLVANWVKSGGVTLDKPTHFEQTAGAS